MHSTSEWDEWDGEEFGEGGERVERLQNNRNGCRDAHDLIRMGQGRREAAAAAGWMEMMPLAMHGQEARPPACLPSGLPTDYLFCSWGASINDIRNIFGFFDPLPPCPHLELINPLKITEPPYYVRVRFSMNLSPLPPVRTSYLDSPLVLATDAISSLSKGIIRVAPTKVGMQRASLKPCQMRHSPFMRSATTFSHLKVVVALEEGAGLEESGVELVRLGAGVTVDPEEEVVLNILVADRGRRPNHVG